MPPLFADAYVAHAVRLLAVKTFLVQTQMQIRRIIEQLRDLTDQVGADLIVLFSTDHVPVFAQPRVVARREVELGYGGQSL